MRKTDCKQETFKNTKKGSVFEKKNLKTLK